MTVWLGVVLIRYAKAKTGAAMHRDASQGQSAAKYRPAKAVIRGDGIAWHRRCIVGRRIAMVKNRPVAHRYAKAKKGYVSRCDGLA